MQKERSVLNALQNNASPYGGETARKKGVKLFSEWRWYN